MLTEEHSKEDLSRAYVQAVGARAGVIVSLNSRGHDYGIDGSFHQVSILDGNRVESGWTLDFQLKATTRINMQEDFVQYQLDADTMNLLASRIKKPRATPAILIILSLPTQSEEWLQLSEEALILKNCCYWTRISSFTSNLYTVTHKIPRSQLFTPEKLRGLLEEISNEVLI
jgi:hypothetical protein